MVFPSIGVEYLEVKESNKMYLFLFTLIYCVITQMLSFSFEMSFGVYLIGLALIKGLSSGEIKDIFNFKKTRDVFKENRFIDSLMELFSLVIVFINAYIIDYEPFSPFEFVYTFFLLVVLYRFLFWGIIRESKKWLHKES
ncbi:hypothetical protein VK97_02825 [Bacillus sp. LK10]|nr:hypothetical protein VL09_02970 [Bacillus stratosphericus]KML61554.1 hypothetical protein VL19_09195 [Bacillus stratosphericus]KMN33641.1 hypothetical protein ABW26_05305 [Bacillus stratosphericus]KMN75593.1 hypothetical protein VK97_02825 [Bacillus sp. LK10]